MKAQSDVAGQPGVVLIHGLWFRAWSLQFLARRMRRQGFNVACFSYPTTRQALEVNAEVLNRFCQQQSGHPLHLMGHSLGGLLILRMLYATGWDRPGRVLLLGSPLTGSAVARQVTRWPAGQKLFGQAVDHLGMGVRHWPEQRETGMIAGTSPVGLGRITGGLERPNDGTVALSETHHSGLNARIELPVTHTGMLLSKDVVAEAAEFLHKGRFSTGS